MCACLRWHFNNVLVSDFVAAATPLWLRMREPTSETSRNRVREVVLAVPSVHKFDTFPVGKDIFIFGKPPSNFLRLSQSRLEATNILFVSSRGTRNPLFPIFESFPP